MRTFYIVKTPKHSLTQIAEFLDLCVERGAYPNENVMKTDKHQYASLCNIRDGGYFGVRIKPESPEKVETLVAQQIGEFLKDAEECTIEQMDRFLKFNNLTESSAGIAGVDRSGVRWSRGFCYMRESTDDYPHIVFLDAVDCTETCQYYDINGGSWLTCEQMEPKEMEFAQKKHAGLTTFKSKWEAVQHWEEYEDMYTIIAGVYCKLENPISVLKYFDRIYTHYLP